MTRIFAAFVALLVAASCGPAPHVATAPGPILGAPSAVAATRNSRFVSSGVLVPDVPTTTTTTATTSPPQPPQRPVATSTAPKRVTSPQSAPRATQTLSGYTCGAAVAAISAAGAPASTLRTWDAIAWRESRCGLGALRAVGGDFSVCWWQIEYGHGLAASRTATFGSPSLLTSSPAACARAALSLYRTSGWQPWS
jgi:hypothetical protein